MKSVVGAYDGITDIKPVGLAAPKGTLSLQVNWPMSTCNIFHNLRNRIYTFCRITSKIVFGGDDEK